jgi:hypothetical protein
VTFNREIRSHDMMQTQEARMNPIIEEVVQRLAPLPGNLQQKVLDFVQAMVDEAQKGTPGVRLLHFAGTIPLTELETMRRAIEKGCEQVEPHGW